MDFVKKLLIVNAPFFALTHILALKLYLYWYYWWFDIFMHLWGGTLVSLVVFSLASMVSFFELRLKHIAAILLMVTVAWEVFEWRLGLWNNDYVVDTLQDIFFGFLGGIVTYIIIVRFKKN